jgi:phosphoribosylaminoimidazole (AIR) synthetase
MVLIVREGDEAATIQVLRESGETAFVIGHTEAHSADKQMIILR